jgi:hypothetical protein
MVGLTVVEGDVIRAYDFKPMLGRDDCYIEGRVVDAHSTQLGFQSYKVVVTKDYFGSDRVTTTAGPDSRVGIEMFVPWRTDFMEFQGRVINLSR